MQTEIIKALKVLKQGGIILYPTDTIWGIGCDASNQDAIQKIYKIKQREESKALISLVSDTNMLFQYTNHIPKFKIAYPLFDLVNDFTFSKVDDS